MACTFSSVVNACGCPTGWNIPLLDGEENDISSYPVNVLNVNEEELGWANGPSEYAAIWNSDTDNQAHGVLYVGEGAFCFYLKKINDTPPPEFVIGAPPAQLQFKYGATDLDTTGDVPEEEAYIESVDDVFTATDELIGTFPEGGNVTVADFENAPDDKVLFIQVPASEDPFTRWSEVGNPLQQNRPINPDFATGNALFFRSTRDGETIYLTRYQTSFTGAIVLSR